MPHPAGNLDTLSSPPTSDAKLRAQRAAARAQGLELSAAGHVCTEAVLELGFATALAVVTLTGDDFDDRQALARAAASHAATVTGWDRGFLDDLAERAVERTLNQHVVAPAVRWAA